MSLPTSPLARIVSGVSASVSQVSNAGTSAFQSVASDVSKLKLDEKIAAASGAIGSGLNGATSAIRNGASQFGADARAFNANLSTAASQVAGFAGASAGTLSQGINQVAAGIAGAQSLANNVASASADISDALSKASGGSLATGLSNIAGALSKGAGFLNDILSQRRGVNIPSGAEYVRSQGSAIKLQPGSKDDWRVKIQAPWNLFGSKMFDMLEETGGVVFPYLPNITVSTKANYTNVDTVHSNYPYYAYKNSTVEEIQIAGEFSSETETDAAYWIAATTFFKTATKMFFGQGENAGNPPIICNLTGYGASVFDRVPIVITSFSVDLKDDVNYVQCNVFGTNTWVPIISNISISVVPIYSRESLRKFDLKKYAAGQMVSESGVGYL
jgi:uncharacterized protein YoxC